MSRRIPHNWRLASALCALTVLGAVVSCANRNKNGSDSPGGTDDLPLVVKSSPVDLGSLAPGQRASATLRVLNVSGTEVFLADVKTSCPCVHVIAKAEALLPQRATDIQAEFDPSEEPDFRGTLMVDVTGRSKNGVVVLHAYIKVTVKEAN
jgi:hypothetical protein